MALLDWEKVWQKVDAQVLDQMRACNYKLEIPASHPAYENIWRLIRERWEMIPRRSSRVDLELIFDTNEESRDLFVMVMDELRRSSWEVPRTCQCELCRETEPDAILDEWKKNAVERKELMLDDLQWRAPLGIRIAGPVWAVMGENVAADCPDGQHMNWIEVPAQRILEISEVALVEKFDAYTEAGTCGWSNFYEYGSYHVNKVYRFRRKKDGAMFKHADLIQNRRGCYYLKEL